MSLRALLAAAVVVAVPVAVNGAQQQPQTQTPDPQARRTCTVRGELGSRLNRVRTCRNAAEREAAKQEQRQVVDRIQSNKVTFGQ